MVKNKYAILILAAGGSKRMGRPKQLIWWKQSTLLNHIIDQALKVKNTDVFVALGGKQEEILNSITQNISILSFPNWQEGMGSTISYCLKQIAPLHYDGIILSVCDQPFITCKIFENLIAAYENGSSTIIVSKYDTSSGPPTFFSHKYFSQLSILQGDVGAKEIVRTNANALSYIDFYKGDIDIDTENDLTFLNES